MEVLVSISAFAVIGLGLTVSNVAAMKVAKSTEINYAVSTLAASRMEELAALDITNLDASSNETNQPVTWPGLNIGLKRTTQITVNPNDSRDVLVTVASTSTEYPTSITLRTNFAAWE